MNFRNETAAQKAARLIRIYGADLASRILWQQTEGRRPLREKVVLVEAAKIADAARKAR